MLRFLVTICIGVAGTLAWQSYGDVARQMMADSSPVLGWLAPQAVSIAQAAPDQIPPAAPSLDLRQLKAMSLDLAAQHQQIQQMASNIATMQAAQQEILRKVSTLPPPSPRQVAAPARNAVQN